MFALLTLAGFVIGERFAGEAGGRTMAFTVLSLSQIVQAYNMRTEHSLFKAGFFGNRKLNLSCLLSFVLVLLVLFTPANTVFALSYLPYYLYLCALGLSFVPLVVMEISKAAGLIKHQK